MFEWNDEDGLTDTIWGDLIEKDDHIVPYPKTTNDTALFRIEDYNNNLNDDKNCGESRSFGQNRSDHKNEFSGSKPDSSFPYAAKISASSFGTDPWSTFPSIESSDKKEGDGNDGGSTCSSMFNDFVDTPRFNRVRDGMFSDLNHSSEIQNNSEHGHKEVNSFLDCDWASITDFDDLDGIFRNNNSALEQDKALSPSDSINASAQPFLLPEDQEAVLKRKDPDDKTALDALVDVKKMASRQLLENNHSSNKDSSKEHDRKKLLKSRRKSEQRTTSTENTISSGSRVANPAKQYENPPPAISSFYTSPFQQKRPVGEPAYLSYYPPQQILMGYGYPAPPLPTAPLVPFIPPSNTKPKPVWTSNIYSGSEKHYKPVQNQQEASPKILTMTPQEKIEKLRRRQQMQAMIAIKQQEKQFGQQSTSVDVDLPQMPLKMNQISSPVTNAASGEEIAPSLELKMPTEQEESHSVSNLSDDFSLQESIFHELQETVIKLNHNVRFCLRDSLFRLAKSATERRTGKRSSTKMVGVENDILNNQETFCHERSMGGVTAETDTNPIDRIVANLLFNRSAQQTFSVPYQSNTLDENLESKADISRAVKGKAPL